MAIFLFPPHILSDFPLQHGTISLPLAKTCFQIWSLSPSFLDQAFISVSLLQCWCCCSLPARFAITSVRPRWRDPKSVLRRKISGLLCVKSTSFSFLFFFFQVRHLKPIFKPVRNNNVSTIPVYAPVRNMPAKLAGYRIVFVEANPTDILQILGTT